MWLSDVVAHLAVLAVLTWRGVLWRRPWFAVALGSAAVQYAVLAQIPMMTSAYFLAFCALDVLELAALALATHEAHRQRFARIGRAQIGDMGAYALAASALVAAGVLAALIAVGQWSDPWLSWQLQALQLGRHACKMVMFFFSLFSLCLFDRIDSAGGDARGHHRTMTGWLSVGVSASLLQLSVFGGRANFDSAAGLDILWCCLAALGYSGALDRSPQQSGHRPAGRAEE
jgi:hypothetical protein